MELGRFVYSENKLMKDETLKAFLDWLKTQDFEDGKIAGMMEDIKDTNVRDTKILPLQPSSRSMTNVHWFNNIAHAITKVMRRYQKFHVDLPVREVIEIQVLKYELNGKYVWHVDHGPETSRTLSAIWFLNDDYEGGELNFCDPMDIDKTLQITPESNKIVIWPSNHLFPHAVSPVTSGTRYSLVAWMK